MEAERQLVNTHTLRKHDALFQFVRNMRVAEKRHLFKLLRAQRLVGLEQAADLFFCRSGLFVGDFCCFYLLADGSHERARPSAGPKQPADGA